MASADAMSEGGEEMAASLPVIDELLAEIFLRLPTAADLVRSSAVCVSFHRIATARPFVRRFRKLHAPPLLGFLDEDQTFHPAAPPHPSAPAGSATALAADFSFSFLPAPARASAWAVQDSRDGRILLHTDEAAVFTETVVCDPLHHRYLLLPPIPDDLSASLEDPYPLDQPFWRETFLLPPSGDAEEEETSFRVVWMGQCKTKLFVFVFSSGTGQWLAIPPARWEDLFPGLTPSTDNLFCFRQYAYGRFYWRSECETETDMLVLDTRRMEFSIAESPPEAKTSYGPAMAMVEAGEGRPGMFVVLTDDAFALSYSIFREQDDDNGGGQHWQHEKTIPLGSGHFLIGSTQSYLLLYRYGSTWLQSGFYTLDVKTFHLQQICQVLLYGFLRLRSYSNFPPSFLSLPTVSSGIQEEAEGML